ncbi:MAG: SppA protein [Gemmatimonadaceae bacterium]|nr:SppA protein [Gemmatimonadaceae bacterium]
MKAAAAAGASEVPNKTDATGTIPEGATPTPEERFKRIVHAVSDSLDADIFYYNGQIAPLNTYKAIEMLRSRPRRTNVLLVMVTAGGDPAAAYRFARALQELYTRFTVLVTGYCKSAGTLIACGAHELVFGPHGELGPLDVQMSKRDHLFEMQSGLTVNAALTALHVRAYSAFKHFLLQIEIESEGAITVATAGDFAVRLTTGLFAPLYKQVDPFHVGEAARAMGIAQYYGARLSHIGQNLPDSSLTKLMGFYPSHGFVIDRVEAETIFSRVRQARGDEVPMVDMLISIGAYLPNGETAECEMQFLNDPRPTPHDPGGIHAPQHTPTEHGTSPDDEGGLPAAGAGSE